MSLIRAAGLGKYYGALDVFKNASFSIEHQDRIGLVGPNGEGKTTLLRLLAGIEEATSGKLDTKRGLRLGYLPQDPPLLEGATLWQTMLAVFVDLRRQEAELSDLAERLEDEGILQRYSQLQSEFEHAGGYQYETRIGMVLSGLGFGPEQFDQPVAQLSGGQKTRLLLAQLILEEPDLLLLDEPTNHLDLVAVEWLENWAQNFKGSIVVVSHDRYFLDEVTNRTWEMAFGVLERYRGNYSAYARQRQERYQQRLKHWEEQQEYIAQTEDFVRRYIAGQRTKEAQGRRVRLERFMRDEAIEKPQQSPHIRVRLSPPKRSGDRVLEFGEATMGYKAGTPIVEIRDTLVRRGQRVAVVGPNGVGKTTMVRSILGEIDLLGGHIRHGASVELGYLSQTHDYLDPEMTVLEAARQIKPEMKPNELRPVLANYLFQGDDVYKRIGELSGGQRSRVALARLALQEVNVLLLDEPTNHLDIASQEVLEDVLKYFDGTLILVSHDRFLIQALSTHIWIVGDGSMQALEGSWKEYMEWRSEGRTVAGSGKVDEREERQQQRQAQKEERRLRKQGERMQKRQQELEEEIHGLEQQLGELSKEIGRAGEQQDVEQVQALGMEYQQLEKQMEGLWGEWEELAETLEV